MSLVSSIRHGLKRNETIRRFVAYYLAPSGLFDSLLMRFQISPEFQRRIDLVTASSDNQKIAKVADAGKVRRGKQIMHNGLRIQLGSYYGPEIAQLLYRNQGVHEPQEEYVFQEVLKGIPRGATMLELGSFWAFYSMWFASRVPEARNYMVEPDSFNLGFGKNNFRLNKLRGDFTNAFVNDEPADGSPRTIGIDAFLVEKEIEFLDILHCDIQGYELRMLKGARQTLLARRVGYLFISTHSNDLHLHCIDALRDIGYGIVCDVDLDRTFSEDGLIVAKSPAYPGIEHVVLSERTHEQPS